MRGDAAVSDFVATLLLVALVVVLGSVLAVAVTSSLERAAPPAASIALAAASPGDATVRLVLRNGEPIPLAGISVTLQRNASAPVDVPRAAWSTPDAATWRPGETLALTLSPTAGQDERLHVRVVAREANAVLTDASLRTPWLSPDASPLGSPTLVAQAIPTNLSADATNASLLTVQVSHPGGALSVSGVRVDLKPLMNVSATLDLADVGSNGDALGGDGVWSGLLRAPVNATPGRYSLPVQAVDLTGRTVATTTVEFNVTASLATILSNATALFSNITNFSGNFYGSCYGCIVYDGVVVIEGSRIMVPSSQNVTSLRLANWTWDRLHPARLANDAMVARIVSGQYAWSVYLRFSYPSNGPGGIKYVEVWNANATTTYVPATGTQVPLATLDLDLLDPVKSGFRCDTGCASRMTYNNATIQGSTPTFVVAWLRDETNNFQTDEIGIYAVDVVAR